MKNTHIALIGFGLLWQAQVWAGGDFVEAHITHFSGSNGIYHFSVMQNGKPLYANQNCPDFQVVIAPPKRTYWERTFPAWLHRFIAYKLSSSHPNIQQTTQAARVLQHHAQQNKALLFGYMGGGLAANPQQKCLFHGTGMTVEQHKNQSLVMIYQDARRELYPYLQIY